MGLKDEHARAQKTSPPVVDLKGMVAFLASQGDVAAAYLFGSLARGQGHPQSDVDVAVLLREGPDRSGMFERQLRLMGELEVNMARFRNVLVHEYVPVDDALVYSILQRTWGISTALPKPLSPGWPGRSKGQGIGAGS